MNMNGCSNNICRNNCSTKVVETTTKESLTINKSCWNSHQKDFCSRNHCWNNCSKKDCWNSCSNKDCWNSCKWKFNLFWCKFANIDVCAGGSTAIKIFSISIMSEIAFFKNVWNSKKSDFSDGGRGGVRNFSQIHSFFLFMTAPLIFLFCANIRMQTRKDPIYYIYATVGSFWTYHFCSFPRNFFLTGFCNLTNI